MDVYEAVTKRRAIRRFQDRPVPYDILEKCLNAGRLAPSARNRQLCEYLIVDDKQLLPDVFSNLGGTITKPSAGGVSLPATRPKAYIIILINVELEAESGMPRAITTYDAAMSAENIILVALEQGIGSCPVMILNEKGLKEALNIPGKYDVALLIAMGYPDESPVAEVADGSVDLWLDDQDVRHVPKRKLEDIIHRNKFPE